MTKTWKGYAAAALTASLAIGMIGTSYGATLTLAGFGADQKVEEKKVQPQTEAVQPQTEAQQIRDNAAAEGEKMIEDGRYSVDEDIGAMTKIDVNEMGEEASIVKFVNQIIAEADRQGATDIHIEPQETELRIRYRIDGMLHKVDVPPQLNRLKSAIISRIKVMANLDIAEKRLPMDGRIGIRIAGQDIDIRVSTMPAAYGESISLRLLAKSGNFVKMDDLIRGHIEVNTDTLDDKVLEGRSPDICMYRFKRGYGASYRVCNPTTGEAPVVNWNGRDVRVDEAWLCPVTLLVLFRYPRRINIYIKED